MPIRNVFSLLVGAGFLQGLPGPSTVHWFPSPGFRAPPGVVGINSLCLQAEVLQGTEGLGAPRGKQSGLLQGDPVSTGVSESTWNFLPSAAPEIGDGPRAQDVSVPAGGACFLGPPKVQRVHELGPAAQGFTSENSIGGLHTRTRMHMIRHTHKATDSVPVRLFLSHTLVHLTLSI